MSISLYMPDNFKSIFGDLDEIDENSSRCEHATAGVTALVANTLGTVGSVFAMIGYIFGNEKAKTLIKNLAPCSSVVLSNPYQCFIKTLNPQAVFNEYQDEQKRQQEGLTYSKFLVTSIMDRAVELGESDSFFQAQVLSRVHTVLFLVAAAVTRVVDGILGTLAAAASILTVGNFEVCNDVAYYGLQCTGVIADVECAVYRLIHATAT